MSTIFHPYSTYKFQDPISNILDCMRSVTNGRTTQNNMHLQFLGSWGQNYRMQSSALWDFSIESMLHISYLSSKNLSSKNVETVGASCKGTKLS